MIWPNPCAFKLQRDIWSHSLFKIRDHLNIWSVTGWPYPPCPAGRSRSTGGWRTGRASPAVALCLSSSCRSNNSPASPHQASQTASSSSALPPETSHNPPPAPPPASTGSPLQWCPAGNNITHWHKTHNKINTQQNGKSHTQIFPLTKVVTSSSLSKMEMVCSRLVSSQSQCSVISFRDDPARQNKRSTDKHAKKNNSLCLS